MIYNENGMIVKSGLSELNEFLNSYSIIEEINEGFAESIKNSKFGKAVSELWNKILNWLESIIRWISELGKRISILKNKAKIKENLEKYFEKNYNTKKLKGDIAKYMYSEGYRNGKWIETFNNAINFIFVEKNAKGEINTDKINDYLYNKKSDSDWFEINDTSKLSSSDMMMNTGEILNYSLNISSLLKPLRSAYNNLKKSEKSIKNDSEKLNTEVMQTIAAYCNKAISSIKNFSTACIQVCINASKGDFDKNFENIRQDENSNDQDNNEMKKQKTFMITDKNQELKDILSEKGGIHRNTKRVRELLPTASEDLQMEAVKQFSDLITCIKNPSKEIQMVALEDNPQVIQLIDKQCEDAKWYILKKGKFYLLPFIQNPTDEMIMYFLKENPSGWSDLLNWKIEVSEKIANYIDNDIRHVKMENGKYLNLLRRSKK